jgi:hypothetical protein
MFKIIQYAWCLFFCCNSVETKASNVEAKRFREEKKVKSALSLDEEEELVENYEAALGMSCAYRHLLGTNLSCTVRQHSSLGFASLDDDSDVRQISSSVVTRICF